MENDDSGHIVIGSATDLRDAGFQVTGPGQDDSPTAEASEENAQVAHPNPSPNTSPPTAATG